MCFIDLAKGLNRVRLKNITTMLRQYNAADEIAWVIENMNTNKTTSIILNHNLTKDVSTSTVIRQGNLLSPILFIHLLDKIAEDAKSAVHGFRTNKGKIVIVCYVNDAVIISENQSELQRHQFYLMFKQYNMVIAVQKTKTPVIAKEKGVIWLLTTK